MQSTTPDYGSVVKQLLTVEELFNFAHAFKASNWVSMVKRSDKGSNILLISIHLTGTLYHRKLMLSEVIEKKKQTDNHKLNFVVSV